MSVANTFDQFQAGSAPATLKGPFGEAWNAANGLIKDGFAEGAIQAVKARFAATAPEDALAYIGLERSLPRGPTETVAAYRARLLVAWTAWQQAGTKPGLITALNALGYPNVFVLEDNLANFPLSPPASGFAPGTEWWRFMVFIRPPHQFVLARQYGAFPIGSGGTWGDGGIWGVGGPPGALAAIRSTIVRWQPAHAKMIALGVVFSGGVWGDGGAWGDGRVWGGSVAYV